MEEGARRRKRRNREHKKIKSATRRKDTGEDKEIKEERMKVGIKQISKQI